VTENILLGLLGLAGAWLMAAGLLQGRNPVWHWFLVGYPVTLVRMLWTWRRLCVQVGLVGDPRGARVMIAGMAVQGQTLRPVIPPLRPGSPVRDGLTAQVRLLPGQVPQQYAKESQAIMHAWRVHSVRVSSPRRGWVEIRAYSFDPLAGIVRRDPDQPVDSIGHPGPDMSLALTIGVREDTRAWVIDLRVVPHWMIVGATRSGKSTLIHSVVGALAPLPVALVGVDLKGGLELSVYGLRLSGLAVSRTEAADLLEEVLSLAFARMANCRAAGVQSIWQLPQVPPPVVVIVDEVAELYLPGDSAERQLRERCAAALLRLAQLGAALGIYLLICGQRIGSDLGTGVTALRAQLGGRICHRVNDEETAKMALGDLFPEAVAAALLLTPADQGVAITTDGAAGWVRARSALTTSDQAAETARQWAAKTPALAGIVRPDFTRGGEAA
jgi:DNA segregation ATPase FtsK/SpoIIIE, S-DNA-T family